MPAQRRFTSQAWIPIAAGVAWFWFGAQAGLVGFVFAVIAGAFLAGAGAGALLWPGDPRSSQFAALGGVAGAVLALPAMITAGVATGALLLALSVAAFLAAGMGSLRRQPLAEEVPAPVSSLALAAKVATDECLLATVHLTLPLPSGEKIVRIEREVAEARELYEARGWLEKPEEFHRRPPPLASPRIGPARVRGIPYERVSFESEYEPHAEEPGRDRWLDYRPNRTAGAWVLRHGGDPRPWLVCLHGYQMGWPLADFALFRPEWLHRQLEMNVIVPTLPLHGRRKVGRRSGDGFLAGDVLDSIHAEAQAMWDVRRLLSWVAAQDAPRVGVLGFSLGGYNTALLASLEKDLACAIAGIPLADFARIMTYHGPLLRRRYVEHSAFDVDAATDVLRVVSPLALEPKVPRERRYLFGGVADRLVPPDQVRDLWLHWERPRIVWYQGAHVTFRGEPAVRKLIHDGLRDGGLIA